MPEAPRPEASPPPRRGSLLRGNLLWLSLVSLLNDSASEMIYPLLPLFLTGVLGAGPAFLGIIEGVAEASSSLLKLAGGVVADRFGRRLTLMITALMTIPVAPLYLLTTDYTMIVVFFTLQGFFGGGGMHTQWPHYLSERFPTEVRATATGFCYHQGAIFGGLVGPVLAYFTTDWHMGFAIPMLIGTTVAATSVVIVMLFSPETRGRQIVADIQLL